MQLRALWRGKQREEDHILAHRTCWHLAHNVCKGPRAKAGFTQRVLRWQGLELNLDDVRVLAALLRHLAVACSRLLALLRRLGIFVIRIRILLLAQERTRARCERWKAAKGSERQRKAARSNGKAAGGYGKAAESSGCR